MSRLHPVSWKEFVRRFHELGFGGPFSGGRHPQMKRGNITVIIPNQHEGDIGVGVAQAHTASGWHFPQRMAWRKGG